jgi:hypothetical protein
MYDGRSISPAAVDTDHFSCSLTLYLSPYKHGWVALGQHIVGAVGSFAHACVPKRYDCAGCYYSINTIQFGWG